MVLEELGGKKGDDEREGAREAERDWAVAARVGEAARGWAVAVRVAATVVAMVAGRDLAAAVRARAAAAAAMAM